MLQELILCLYGNPSPLLTPQIAFPPSSSSVLTPPERALLQRVSNLANTHLRLISSLSRIISTHRSPICRAVAHTIDTVYLKQFRGKVLEVETSILTKDASLVGAYDAVPLTAVVGEFEGWVGRMEWLWGVVCFMEGRMVGEDDDGDEEMYENARAARQSGGGVCTGAKVIDNLRKEMQTGYREIEQMARELAKVAGVAWLKMVSGWILFGKLPVLGAEDFFVHEDSESGNCEIVGDLRPYFVMRATAETILFLGTSVRRTTKGSIPSIVALTPQLKRLSSLTHPLTATALSRSISEIHRHYSRTVLQKLLPTASAVDMLCLLRDFFLLGRGDFGTVLIEQADEKSRTRHKKLRPGDVLLQVGEVASVLTRTWAAMAMYVGQVEAEDEQLESARKHLRLVLHDGKNTTSSSNFNTLLVSQPVDLTMQIQEPLDLLLSPADINTYATMHTYMLAIRRGHLRLTELWKISSIRRHFPPPPSALLRENQRRSQHVRERHADREKGLRGVWSTCNATAFFLSEVEAYFQSEVIDILWADLRQWAGSEPAEHHEDGDRLSQRRQDNLEDDTSMEDGNVLAERAPLRVSLDPNTLANAHRRYLVSIESHILVSREGFATPLLTLLKQIDQLVALITRLSEIWTHADLESDAGVEDAHRDLAKEEKLIKEDLMKCDINIKMQVRSLLEALEIIEASRGDEIETDRLAEFESSSLHGRQYSPKRLAGLSRLLTKLDFGSWLGIN